VPSVSARHEPVLVRETLAWLCNGAGLYLDATLGDGGHAAALLDAEPEARLLGTDRDPDALAFARARLAPFGDRVTVAHAAFRAVPGVHRDMGGEPFTGVLLDLGLSSRQIDDPARGISFMREGPLDLRMDPGHGAPAAERLEAVTPEALADVLRARGDVAGARRLAQAIVEAARAGRLATTRDLVAVIERAAGGRVHPRRLAQVFQAIRMWVNEEHEELEGMLAWLPEAVRPGGVVVTIAYHSGEDRAVTRSLAGRGMTRPARWPEPEPKPLPWKSLMRRVVTPSPEEVATNPRARSARLRAFRRNPE